MSLSGHELPFFEMTLYKDTVPLYRAAQRHWWLTGFRMGHYCEPESLLLKVNITFPSSEMNHAFLRSLTNCGGDVHDIRFCGQQVSFEYGRPSPEGHPTAYSQNPVKHPKKKRGIRAAFAQWENRIFLRLYCRVTKPFTCTADRLLFLWEYLPGAFRHMLRIRHKKTLRRQRHVH